MVNTTLLKEKVKESGYRPGWIAEQLGITRSAWSYKINGQRSFSAEEVEHLCKLLKIRSARERETIFFSPEC